MASVTLRSVSKHWGTFVGVADVSLDIGDGEFLVLLGPSGCGKSTTMRIVAGLDDPTQGEVLIGDKVVNDLAPGERDLAMVFQNYGLYPHMTVAQNMGFGLRMNGVPRAEIEERVGNAARILQIEELMARKPRQLSGGQRQRVAIGRAIVRNPQVFLFDEPLSNLDAALRGQTRVEIANLHRELGATTIYVTHDQVEAMTLADRVVVLRDGNIEQVGSPLSLYDRPANRFVAQFIGTPRMNVLPLSGLPRAPEQANLPDDGFFGIRPENVDISTQASDGYPATVDLVESLGAETLVYSRLENGLQLVARSTERAMLHPGDRIGLRLDPQRMHIFDAAGRATRSAFC